MANQLFRTKPLSMLLDEMKGENRLRRILGPVQLTRAEHKVIQERILRATD